LMATRLAEFQQFRLVEEHWNYNKEARRARGSQPISAISARWRALKQRGRVLAAVHQRTGFQQFRLVEEHWNAIAFASNSFSGIFQQFRLVEEHWNGSSKRRDVQHRYRISAISARWRALKLTVSVIQSIFHSISAISARWRALKRLYV